MCADDEDENDDDIRQFPCQNKMDCVGFFFSTLSSYIFAIHKEPHNHTVPELNGRAFRMLAMQAHSLSA